MSNLKTRVKPLIGNKTTPERDVAQVGDAEETEVTQKALVPVQQNYESNAVPTTSSSEFAAPKATILETSRYNFKIVHDPPDPIVDIFFIHGLTGTREQTWTRTKGKQSCFWPQDLLSEDIPEARIAVWGYNVSVIKKTPGAVVSTNTLDHHAQTLCSDIASLRREKHKQPIIFVVHSLGGLVCKTALLHASEAKITPRSHLYSVYTSTLGIAFMGSPHQDSSKAGWRAMVASILGYLKQDNKIIVETLEKEAPHLNELQKRFINLLEGRKQEKSPIDITCFYEELPVPVLGTIVPDQSATILGYEGIGIHADHFGMTKFGSDENPGYLRVLGELKQWVGKIQVKDGGAKENSKVEALNEAMRSVSHYGNVNSGGTALYGQQSFQNSGVTNIGGVHTVHHAERKEEETWK